MRRYFLVILVAASVICANGQSVIKVPAGKKFQLVTNTTTTTMVTVMGQSIVNVMDSKVIQEYAVQSTSATGYALSVTTKKLTGKISVMGQEQSFDSDDEATKSNPQLAESLSFIGKPQEIKVENGKVTSSGEIKNMLSAMGMNPDNQSEVTKLFLSVPVESIKNGYSWTDSASSNTFSVLNKYIVTATTDQQVEVRVTSETKMNTTLNQGGMEMQTDMKGFSTSTRTYDKKTGLLMTEKVASEITGTAEGMGIKAPMTIKMSAQTSVQ